MAIVSAWNIVHRRRLQKDKYSCGLRISSGPASRKSGAALGSVSGPRHFSSGNSWIGQLVTRWRSILDKRAHLAETGQSARTAPHGNILACKTNCTFLPHNTAVFKLSSVRSASNFQGFLNQISFTMKPVNIILIIFSWILFSTPILVNNPSADYNLRWDYFYYENILCFKVEIYFLRIFLSFVYPKSTILLTQDSAIVKM